MIDVKGEEKLNETPVVVKEPDFIPVFRYWPRQLFKFIKTGEVGILRGKRYLLK